MQKILTLFQRNYEGDRLVRNVVTPGAEWVVAGEGVATRKFDGTCCLVRNAQIYKRYDAKRGKTPPANFEPAQPEPDPVTGHWPGWVPVGAGPEDRWHREGWDNSRNLYVRVADGTYELCGPQINGGAEGGNLHDLVRHGSIRLDPPYGFTPVPRDFAGLRAYLTAHAIEGIVWHHPDGRMVKIKRKDFGLPWPVAPWTGKEARQEQGSVHGSHR